MLLNLLGTYFSSYENTSLFKYFNKKVQFLQKGFLKPLLTQRVQLFKIIPTIW